MKLPELRAQVCAANKRLAAEGLVTLTWGNVSGIDRDAGLLAIKPSGVDYDAMGPEHMVLVDLDGNVAEGDLRPSSDTPTHVALYNAFSSVGGVTHTHSAHATVLSQTRTELPCLGTTHADHFMGPVPVTRQLTEHEVSEAYEVNTGRVIVERFTNPDDGEPIDPAKVPSVLVAGHAPFSWGNDAQDSVKNAITLEACARMAILSGLLNANPTRLEPHVLQKHHDRKHGPNAYYGQKK